MMWTHEKPDGHSDVAPAAMEVRWLAAACLLARHTGESKQQILSAFRTGGVGSHAVASRVLNDFYLNGWIEVREGARGDGREKIFFLSARGQAALRAALIEETSRVTAR